MSPMTVIDYRPSVELDEEIAALTEDAVRGWPDQAPISAELVRSGLRPTGTSATTLVLHRDDNGALDAVGAIRWPATLEAEGLVWGPIVRPTARGAGLASLVLDMLSQVVATRPGMQVRSAPIPASRTMGWALFERAGWTDSGSSSLLKRSLPAPDAAGDAITVRAARQGEYLDQALAALFAAARPHTGYATARDTFQRWASDARYVPDGLLLAEGDSTLMGAALVYPTARRTPGTGGRQYFSRLDFSRADHPRASAAGAQAAWGGSARTGAAVDAAARPRPDEPDAAQLREALLADLITSPELAPDVAQAVRRALVNAALRAGEGAGAVVAKAEAECPDLIATLRSAGFEVADQFRYYAPPAVPAPAPPAVPPLGPLGGPPPAPAATS